MSRLRLHVPPSPQLQRIRPGRVQNRPSCRRNSCVQFHRWIREPLDAIRTFAEGEVRLSLRSGCADVSTRRGLLARRRAGGPPTRTQADHMPDRKRVPTSAMGSA
jgi:hypothetical protein